MRPEISESKPDAIGKIETAAKTYKVGTLVYNKLQLFNVMFWMLGGNICFQIMESLPPQILPLQLKQYGASDKMIGLLSGSLPAIIAIFLNPIIGVQSDRHRGRLGRRRPFLLWCTGPVVFCLLVLAFSEQMSSAVWSRLELSGWVSKQVFTIAAISAFIFMFYIFNTYIISVYQFLFADVIPQEVMGKFVGFYRAIGALALFLFNWFVFGYADRYMWAIYAGTAVLYGISFVLLVWRVKEGEYPPVDPEVRRESFIASLKKYINECFAIPFYLKLYSIVLFYWAAFVPFMTFIIFYATGTKNPGYAASLGMSLDAFGKIKGWTFLLQIPLFFAIGPVIDRFGPLRVIITGIAGCAATYFLSFIFVHSSGTLLFWWLLNSAFAAGFAAAYLAMFPCLLPKDKYGQYFAANNLFGFIGLIAAPVLCGWFLDFVKNYRLLFLWSGFFTVFSLVAAISVYREYQRLGGKEGYKPPEKA